MNLTPDYIAGFLDGEGCIQIVRQRAKDRHAWSYRLAVAVTNTYEPVVRALYERYGGVFGCKDPASKRQGRKRAYYWHASGSRARTVLLEVGPLLHEKRRQADLGLQFLVATSRPKGQWKLVSEEEEALREGFYLALREMKRSFVEEHR